MTTPYILAPRHRDELAVRFRKTSPTVRAASERIVTQAFTDIELIAAISAGDRDALGEVYNRYSSAVTALGKRFRLGQEDLEDVVHDVFLELWQKASEFDPERGALLTWLAVRLRSRCIDRLRKTSRRSALLEQNHDTLRPREVTPPGTAVVERTRLRKAVMELDDELREVTRLAYFEGASTHEIATDLNIPQGTVKSRMRRAREALLTAMTTGAS